MTNNLNTGLLTFLNSIIEEDANAVEPVPQSKRSKNDIKEIKSLRQLDRLDLAIDSPRL